MTSPIPDADFWLDEYRAAQAASPAPLSAGAGFALVGVVAAASLLTAFLCILFFTPILVGQPIDADEVSGASALALLIIPLLPLVFSYKMCTKILERG